MVCEAHWCRKSDTYDSTWGAISDTFDDSTRQFCSFFCRISAVFTVIRKKIKDHLPIANWNTYSQHIHFLQIWYVIEVFRFIRKNIHFLLFYFLYTKDFLNIKLRRVRIMIFSINRGFENDQNLTSKLFDDFGKIKFHPWYSNFEILHFWSSTIIF